MIDGTAAESTITVWIAFVSREKSQEPKMYYVSRGKPKKIFTLTF